MLDRQFIRDQAAHPRGDAVEAPPNRASEVELKLLVPPGTLAQIEKVPAIVRHARNRGVTRRLEATYYDTADRALFRHGLSLRIRRSGGDLVQTLKRFPVNGYPFVRGEWETPATDPTPDIRLLPVSEIGPPLRV
jgi:inorganic triphosphatase YgiF